MASPYIWFSTAPEHRKEIKATGETGTAHPLISMSACYVMQQQTPGGFPYSEWCKVPPISTQIGIAGIVVGFHISNATFLNLQLSAVTSRMFTDLCIIGFRILRQCISVVVTHLVCVSMLLQPQKIETFAEDYPKLYFAEICDSILGS